MGYDLFPHKSGMGLIEPVALIGHNVCVIYANTQYFRSVAWVEPIAPFQFLDIGAVPAASVSARTNALNLQFWRNEFGQIRWYPLDSAQVRVFLPNADGRMNLRNIQVPVDPTIIYRDPCLHLTEMFIWEDRNPAFEAINYTAYALSHVRLVGMGYRFVTTSLSAADVAAIQHGDKPCVYVVASGFSGVP